MKPDQFDANVKMFLSPYAQRLGPKASHTKDGEEYVEITTVRLLGIENPVWHMTLDEAFASWTGMMTRYLSDKTTIVWRIEPEFDSETVYQETWPSADAVKDGPWLKPTKRWKIYARLYAY